MKILFCSSEVFPFSKTGGLGDIASFLPHGIMKLGHEVKIITPYYKSLEKYHDKMTFIGRTSITMGGIETIVNYFELVHNDLPIIFVQNMHYFERDRLYGYNDDAERFACFSYAILEGLSIFNYMPDILHINDWQTGMIPYLLDHHYRHRSFDYYRIHTLLTIHNLEYQGVFDPYVSRFFNTDFSFDYMHFSAVNFLKSGIHRASFINTVSPTYRNETLTPNFGFTLDGALRNRESQYTGILNGINYDIFDPKNDPMIHKNYTSRTIKNKLINKTYLKEKFFLDEDQVPLIGFVGRLAHQKGIDLMKQTLEEVLEYSNAQVILMGSGDQSYQEYFEYLNHKFPDRAACYIGYNEQVAHEIYAGADLFLMPSLFEPCGLGQMIAMRYGTLPIVRETGGLKDTVEPFNLYKKSGTGFTFANYNRYEFKDKIFEAINLYNNDKETFDLIVKNAMKKDYSTSKMALEYEKLYQTIIGG